MDVDARLRLRRGDRGVRRRRARCGAACSLDGAEDVRAVGRRRGRDVCESRMRAVQGAAGGGRSRPGDVGRGPSRVDGDLAPRRGGVRPGGRGDARRAAGRQGAGRARGLAGAAGRGRDSEVWGVSGSELARRRRRRGGDGAGHHPRAGVCAVRPSGRRGRRRDGLHLGRGAAAGARPRVRGHRRLGDHRPRVLGRLHRARGGGHVHRGARQAHARIRQGDRAPRRAAPPLAAGRRLPHGRLRGQGDPREAGRATRRHRDDRRQDQGARRDPRGRRLPGRDRPRPQHRQTRPRRGWHRDRSRLRPGRRAHARPRQA
mmetsp:Transcript_21549/g.67593  ORF Transcript_21549/g.67593 Transcript_21549/m.67593 type:complete len:316 (-) Transcript_21549:716-1663(-)